MTDVVPLVLSLVALCVAFWPLMRGVEESLGDDDYSLDDAPTQRWRHEPAAPDATTVRLKLPRSQRDAS